MEGFIVECGRWEFGSVEIVDGFWLFLLFYVCLDFLLRKYIIFGIVGIYNNCLG